MGLELIVENFGSIRSGGGLHIKMNQKEQTMKIECKQRARWREIMSQEPFRHTQHFGVTDEDE